MPTVVDDATLLAILTRRAGDTSAGSLSTMVANLPPTAKNALLSTLDDLPSEIIVPGPRLVVPVMGALRLRRRVNHLTAEALAVAMISGAGIRVSAEAPLLREACSELGVRLERLPPFT